MQDPFMLYFLNVTREWIICDIKIISISKYRLKLLYYHSKKDFSVSDVWVFKCYLNLNCDYDYLIG